MFKVRNIVKDDTNLIRNKSKVVELPLSKEDEELCEYLIEHLKFLATSLNFAYKLKIY